MAHFSCLSFTMIVWKLFAETDKRMRETDREIQQTARQMRETDRKLQETTKNVDSLTGKWGKFVEGLAAPAAERLFRDRGIRVGRVYQRARARKDGEGMEIDVLAVDGEHAVFIEVKSTLDIEDIQEHIERMEKFKTLFPESADRKAVGALAGIVIDEGVDRYAYRNGLFVITQSGDTVQVMNDEKFVPKEW